MKKKTIMIISIVAVAVLLLGLLFYKVSKMADSIGGKFGEVFEDSDSIEAHTAKQNFGFFHACFDTDSSFTELKLWSDSLEKVVNSLHLELKMLHDSYGDTLNSLGLNKPTMAVTKNFFIPTGRGEHLRNSLKAHMYLCHTIAEMSGADADFLFAFSKSNYDKNPFSGEDWVQASFAHSFLGPGMTLNTCESTARGFENSAFQSLNQLARQINPVKYDSISSGYNL